LALAQQPEKPVAPAAEPDDLIRIQRQRQTVVEQQLRQAVEDEERRARRTLNTDPEAARDILKRILNEGRDNPVLGDALRRDLIARLETSLRNVEVTGARILRENDARVERLAVAAQRRADIETRAAADLITQRRMALFDHLFQTARYTDAVRLVNDIRL